MHVHLDGGDLLIPRSFMHIPPNYWTQRIRGAYPPDY